MENHSQLFFFVIEEKYRKEYKVFYVDTNIIKKDYNQKLKNSSYNTDFFSAYGSVFSEENIVKVSENIRQIRKFRLIINSFADQKSFFYDHNIPKDIICNIAMQYDRIIKSVL